MNTLYSVFSTYTFSLQVFFKKNRGRGLVLARISLLTLLLSFSFKGFASHIVGGALTYTYNGGTNYTIMLKLYRDCAGIAFPANAPISVFQANGSPFLPNRDFTLPGGAIQNIPAVLPPCATTPSVVPCVQERVYTMTVSLPAAPGGMHLVYATSARNASILNIVNPGAAGETFYAFIPCYNRVWAEDFTLVNGTIIDNGATAWSRTVTGVPTLPTAQVTNGFFEVISQNSGSASNIVLATQTIAINTFTNGVNLSVDYIDPVGNTLENTDSIKVYYSLNGGALTLFPVNGSQFNDFDANLFATATGLIGNTVQIFVRIAYGANSPNDEVYDVDMVTVYDNTFLPNSSPSFNVLPPLFLCATNNFTLNQSATDIDGDVLVYSMYQPYNHVPVPTYPNNIASIATITWVPSYSTNSPFNSPTPTVTLNSATGNMTGVANTLGQFVFGVKCSEYRNGILLSEMVRDYEVNTVICPPSIPPAPTITVNSATLCAGQTLSLQASFISGATYSWTGPNSFTSNVQNPTITNASTLATGVYSVNATIAGCVGPYGTVAITVYSVPPSPVAGSNSPLCAGQTLSLTSTTVTGASYVWTGPNSFTAAVQNPTLTNASVLATGVYTVTASVNGCAGPPATISVTVNPIPAAPIASNNSALCAGQTLSLSASFIAGATYSWTGPNTFTSNIQNPTILNPTITASGIYSVVAVVNGCSSTVAVTSVTVNATPAAPIAGSNSTLCAGSTLSLTASNIAGATYSWTGPNSFTSNVQNPTILNPTTTATGSYSVTATVNGCTGPAGVVNVTINPTPAAPIANSNSPLCAGQTLSLTASNIAGATYSWTGPNTFTSNIQNPTILNPTTTATGIYSVTASVNGCKGPAGIISVTINPTPPAPVANSNSPLCALQTLSLTASNIAGATYSWTGPNSFTSNVQNPTIINPTITATGIYTVTATVNGCTGPAGIISVTINPTPITPTAGANSPLCAGQTLSLTSTFIAGATYNWTGPNSFTSNVQNPTIVGASTLATGVYTVSATVNGCTGPAGVISVTVNPPPGAPTVGNNSPICAGATLSLTCSNVIGANYSWLGPNSFTANIQNPTILNATNLASGVYTVTASVPGCFSVNGITTVTVNPSPIAPIAGANSPLCAGQTLSLTASFIAGATYSWTGPNSFTANVQNPTLPNATTLAIGVYSVNATVNGCPGPFGTISVTVNPLPAAPTATATPLGICAGGSFSLSASNMGGATYNWTGPNSYTSNIQNPVVTNASTLATGVYSVYATVNGCQGPAGVISVTVSPIPPAPVAASNSALCAGQTLSLTASNIAGATYSWTGPNTFTSNIQNPTILNPTTTATGIYSVTATVNGCTGPAGVISVTIYPTPGAPVAGSNSPLCIGQTLSLTASNGFATYNWVGPNSFTSTVQNPTIIGTTTLATGIYSVNATINGCTGPSGTVSVLVSMPGTLTAANQTVCANNSTVALSGTSSTGSGTWTSSGTGIFSPNAMNGNYIPSGSDITGGVVTLTLTSTNNGGCPSVKTQITVTITPAPVVNAGVNQSKCANNGTTTLNGSISVASGGIWSSSGTGTFSPNNTTLNGTYIPSAADITAGSVTITLTSTGNGNCVAVTNTMVIIFTPAPVVNAGPATQFVCKNNPNYQLNSTSSTGSASWTTSGTGTFSPNGNILNPLYLSSTADTTAGTITLTLTSTNNLGCNPVSTVITLVYVSTLAVNAGTNQTVCSNGTVGLNGTSTTGSGTWTSSGTGTFNPNNLTGTYYPSAADATAGTVTLTLTSTNNGGCNPVTKTMIVTITPGPTANAGTPQSLCANNATFVLSGTITVASGGIWSSSGTGTFSPNNTNLNTTYIPSAADKTAGTVTITLTTTGNGNCSPTLSTMVLTITPAPLVSAGGTVSVCKNNPVAQLNGTSSTGTGTWTSLGTGTFSPNNSVLNPTYTPSTADTTAGVVTLILTSTGNGNCNPVNDTVKIIYSGPPVVNVGVTQTVCANNSNVVLTGTSSTGSGTWTSSGSGTFTPNSLTGTYFPSGADISGGVVTLTLTSTNNGGCLSVSKQWTVNITPAPTATAGVDQTVCENNATITLNGGVSIASGGVWSSSGTGTFVPNNTNLNTSYVPSPADVTTGTVAITLTTSGNGNCNPVTSTFIVTITPAPQVNAGANMFLCKNNANALLNGTSSTNSGTWTTLGSGNFTPNGNILNPTYNPSQADTTAGTVTLILTSTNNGGCNPVNDTIVINFQSQPRANFSFANHCINSATTFTDMSTVSSGTIVSWLWNFGATTSTVQNASNTFTSTGTQTVSLVVSTGCKDSITKTLYVNPAPTAGLNFTAMCNFSVSFAGSGTVTPGIIKGWNWNFGDTTFSILQNPYHVYKDSGMYIASLTVISDSGCVASIADTVLVGVCSDTVIISNPDVPTGFTPNGDGKNDVLFVKGGPFTSMDFRIFNEWGAQIFQSTIQTSGWDGSFKNAPQTSGRYVWTLSAQVIDGRPPVKIAGETILSR